MDCWYNFFIIFIKPENCLLPENDEPNTRKEGQIVNNYVLYTKIRNKLYGFHRNEHDFHA